MAGYKSHKTELVAIYRLEFYKKQKNWKFAHEDKKAAKTPRSKYTKLSKIVSGRKSLNETYDIETETNESSSLNYGFLDEVPDKLVESPQQTLAPINALSDQALHTLPWSADQHQEPERDNQPWLDVEQVLSEPCWSEPVAPHSGEEPWAAPHDCVDAPREWTQDMHLEELVTAIERCGSLANLSGQCLDTPESACAEGDASSESFAEFVRGAHLAPHSSETDLQLDTPGCGWSGWGAGRAACLSQRALARAVRAHAQALHRLLREARTRGDHQLSRTCCSEQLMPLPSVTPGQFQGLQQPLTRQDTFTVSCSNISTLEGGRGRGRLQRPYNRDRNGETISNELISPLNKSFCAICRFILN